MQLAISPQYLTPSASINAPVRDLLFIKQGQQYYKIKIDDIIYMESDNIYINVHTSSKKYLVRSTLNQYLGILNSRQFFRVHRSFAININHVDTIGANDIQLSDRSIPIGKTYRAELLESLKLG